MTGEDGGGTSKNNGGLCGSSGLGSTRKVVRGIWTDSSPQTGTDHGEASNLSLRGTSPRNRKLTAPGGILFKTLGTQETECTQLQGLEGQGGIHSQRQGGSSSRWEVTKMRASGREISPAGSCRAD